MAEEPEPVNVDDVHMAEVDTSIAVDHPKVDVTSPPATVSSSFPPVPSSTTVIEAVDASSPYSNNSPNDDDIQPPPAKRARMHSDADEASLANVRLFCPVRRYGRANPIYLVVLSEDRDSTSSLTFSTSRAGGNRANTERQYAISQWPSDF